MTRALIPDIVGVRVRPEMARQSIYVKAQLWARAIAPPRSCSNEAATLGMKKVPHALGTGVAGLWSQTLEIRDASIKPQATSLKLKATSRKLPDP